MSLWRNTRCDWQTVHAFVSRLSALAALTDVRAARMLADHSRAVNGEFAWQLRRERRDGAFHSGARKLVFGRSSASKGGERCGSRALHVKRTFLPGCLFHVELAASATGICVF